MKVAVGSDHAGVDVKKNICATLVKLGHEVIDVGPQTTDSVDYPDYAGQVCKLIQKGKVDRGILVCGTGIGMSVVANKHGGIRASLVTNEYTAKMSRAHGNANVLCLGARVVDNALIPEIIRIWMAEPFEGGRHEQRLKKLMELDAMIPIEEEGCCCGDGHCS